MPKQTDRLSPVPTGSPNALLGLIVTGQAPVRSVGAEPALDNRSHRTGSPNALLGLIVTGQAPVRSVGAEPALDNRSHRTDRFQLRRI